LKKFEHSVFWETAITANIFASFMLITLSIGYLYSHYSNIHTHKTFFYTIKLLTFGSLAYLEFQPTIQNLEYMCSFPDLDVRES